MPVKIEKVIDGSLEDLKERKYNIFIPISLGNPFFTRENVREFVLWALEHTRERVLILVADKIQAINYEVLRGMNKKEAMEAALRLGDDFVRMGERVMRSLPPEKQKFVTVARWDDVAKERFLKMQKTLREEYEKNEKFRSEIHRVMKETLKEKASGNEAETDQLGTYIIEEMPIMFNGAILNDQHYEVFLYPGLVELDHLESDIQNRRKFPEMADKLGLTKILPIIEAYIEE